MNAEPKWPPDARRDRLIGNWHIYQRTGGHRTSTDDLICAWYAVARTRQRPEPTPRRYLDLGCGVGSVLFMVAHALRPAQSLGIEAQAQSVLMAHRALSELPADKGDIDIEIETGDFRDWRAAQPHDLVTGSPPYFPIGTGVLPADSQRRACRFEERGGVEDYLATAASAMSASARAYVVFQTQLSERVHVGAAAAKLHVSGLAEFSMRTDDERPFLSVFELGHSKPVEVDRFTCSVRDGDGVITPGYRRIRRELGVELD